VGIIPYPPEGRKTTNSSGPGPIIPYGAPHVEAAAEFVKYLADKETQKAWYRLTKQPPARADALFELIAAGEVADPREVTMLELMPYGFGVPPLSGEVQFAFRDAADLVWRGQITPQQALADIQRQSEPRFWELFG